MSYLKRIEKLQNYLKAHEIHFLILEDPISLLYLTGFEASYGRLIIGQNTVRFFVDGRYLEAAVKKVAFSVFSLTEDLISDFFLVYCPQGSVSIAFDSCSQSYLSYQKLLKFFQKLQKQASKEIIFNLIPINNPLKGLRALKTQEEIFCLKKSAALNWRGFLHICSLLKPGVSEKEIAFEYEMFCKRNGGDRLAFSPIICFGENSSEPHHKSCNTTLKEGDSILIDIGVVVDNYASDLTRVVFLKEDHPLEQLYLIVKMAHNKALNMCKAGMRIGEIDQVVRDFFANRGYGKEFIHGLGHGVGLNVHEFPRIKYDSEDRDIILKPSMVITIEPGLYKKGLGGVRYEDTIVITKEGFENFYTAC